MPEDYIQKLLAVYRDNPQGYEYERSRELMNTYLRNWKDDTQAFKNSLTAENEKLFNELNGQFGAVDDIDIPDNFRVPGKSLGQLLQDTDWSKVTAGISGAASILGMTAPMSQIADTSMQQNQIQDYRTLGYNNYADYGQLYNAYNSADSLQPDLSWDTIRGGSTKERIGSTLSSIGQGASTGFQLGGLWGGLAGAAIGGGAAAVNWINGNRKADIEQKNLAMNYAAAQDENSINMNAANDDIANYEHRNMLARRAENGGQIKRSQSMREFADSVLGNQKSNSVSHSAGIQRKKVDGGVSVRIKRK